MLAYNIHELRTQNQKNGNLDIFIAFWSFRERTSSISIPFLENEWSWGVQCHQDRLFSYCSFSFHTGVTCIDKFLYIGSQQFPVIYALCYTSDTFP